MESISASTVRYGESAERILRCDDAGNLCIVHPVDGFPIQQFLTPTGNTYFYNANLDYSGGVTTIYHEVPAPYTRFEVTSILINVSDNANFNQSDFGAIAGGLTNGIKFYWTTSAFGERQLFSGLAVKQNYQWYSITFHCGLTTFAGTSQTLSSDIQTINEYGKPLTLLRGEKFSVKLNDNLSTLVAFTVQLRGIGYV